MYELKKIGNVFTSKFVGTGPLSYKKRIYRAAVSQRLRNTVLQGLCIGMAPNCSGVAFIFCRQMAARIRTHHLPV